MLCGTYIRYCVPTYRTVRRTYNLARKQAPQDGHKWQYTERLNAPIAVSGAITEVITEDDCADVVKPGPSNIAKHPFGGSLQTKQNQIHY